jgi:hypothetical protein
MVSQNMTFLVDLFDHFGIIPHFCPYWKKGNLDLMASQDLQEIWGCRRVWPIIKSQSDPLCGRITPASGLDEKIEFQYRHAKNEDNEICSEQ